MNKLSNNELVTRQKEMLIVMTALSFIEESGLISHSQLTDAKKSLQALFIRTSGEETMLRKLIDILKINKDLHQAFSAISKISASISTGVEIISKKLTYLKQYVAQLPLTPEENTDFFAPFLSFTHSFQEKILLFSRYMLQYLELREDEAKRTHEFRIAQEASERLKERLSGTLGADTKGEVEQSIKQEVMGNFDYAGAQVQLREIQRDTRIMARQINNLLQELKVMCQMAMNPEMREGPDPGFVPNERYEDIFVSFITSLKQYERLERIRDFIIDYFKLYQRAYGMFVLDFNNFNRAVETIAGNSQEYFDAKQEDEDMRVKRDKLKKYEGLIPFLETTAPLVREFSKEPFTRFSRRLSDMISTENVAWDHVSEMLLIAKVAAEADLTTRLGP